MSERPESRLTRVDRLEAAAEPLRDEGGVSRDTGASSAGTFTGRELNGKRLPGVSADWQTVLVDGTAIGDIRYTLRTDYGALAEATTERASRQRSGSRAASTRRQTSLISVGARRQGCVIFDINLVA